MLEITPPPKGIVLKKEVPLLAVMLKKQTHVNHTAY
jgi:hypothetical protein